LALDVDVFYASDTDNDVLPPSVRAVTSTFDALTGVLTFHVQATDLVAASPLQPGIVARVVVLYRPVQSTSWVKKELAWNGVAGEWTASTLISGPIEYFAQVVDGSGNVTVALDYGRPWQTGWTQRRFLPLLVR